MIPDALRTALQQQLDQPVTGSRPLSGGSINRAARITTEGGNTYFLKWNREAPPEMFQKERQGLQLLAGAGTELRIPEVIALGTAPDGTDYLVLTYIEEGSGADDSARQFGRQLARQHRVTADRHGLDHDNYIGRLPQSNTRHEAWTDFFQEERLEPQLRMARDSGTLGSDTAGHFERLYTQLPALMPAEPPALLHGDLWSGNYLYDTEGRPALVDPAVYYGSREAELAFTHLFGGFAADFYAAYREAYALPPGFEERKDIYNLYPLLVHANLFGASYARQVHDIVRQF